MSLLLPLLTCAQHAHIRNLLKDRHARQADGTFVVEGAKAVRELLSRFPALVRTIVTTPEYRAQEAPGDRRTREASVPRLSYSCSEPSFAKLSDLETPQGILAVVSQPVWSEEDVLAQPVVLGIFGETLQDPLNVGAIIRTAAALGVSGLWLTPDSADRFHPKTVRAASGALCSLPVFIAKEPTRLMAAGCSVFSAEIGGAGVVELGSITRIPRRLILAVGSEGQGLSARVSRQAVRRFTIPMHRGIESLNVAATVAIAMYYFSRLSKQN